MHGHRNVSIESQRNRRNCFDCTGERGTRQRSHSAYAHRTSATLLRNVSVLSQSPFAPKLAVPIHIRFLIPRWLFAVRMHMHMRNDATDGVQWPRPIVDHLKFYLFRIRVCIRRSGHHYYSEELRIPLGFGVRRFGKLFSWPSPLLLLRLGDADGFIV